ncbi:hypothetical protein [Trinickia dabaoshanensis]|uniref:hypothetical protein n=1 Tax=Trinickia dabaoshanensis TaxID=564714 RepID=UPI0011AEED97|nr:hypothetical protein [Trinickia dabaoshanensis]
MAKRIVFLCFLTLPGAFVVLAVLCLHPRCRARIAACAGGARLMRIARATVHFGSFACKRKKSMSRTITSN